MGRGPEACSRGMLMGIDILLFFSNAISTQIIEYYVMYTTDGPVKIVPTPNGTTGIFRLTIVRSFSYEYNIIIIYTIVRQVPRFLETRVAVPV